jgi:hypothetical protein
MTYILLCPNSVQHVHFGTSPIISIFRARCGEQHVWLGGQIHRVRGGFICRRFYAVTNCTQRTC